MEFRSLGHFKSVLSHKLYVCPGDYNYIICRWSFFNGFYREFFWQGLQTIEKYCKAVLVMNGRSVRGDSHGISDLFSQIQPIAGDLLPSLIVAPNEVRARGFKVSTSENFVARVYSFGHPDTRYNHISYNANTSDLIKMDWICFNLRRATIDLSGIVGADWPVRFHEEEPGRTYGEVIAAHPGFQVRGDIELPAHRTEQKEEELRSLIHRYNFAYRRNDLDLHEPPDSAMLENSYLFLLSEALQRSDQSEVLKEGTKWLVDAMRFSRGTQEYFLNLLK